VSFYIHPRVSPDGAEEFLTTPQTMRSVPRLYPFAEWEEMPGLYPADVDIIRRESQPKPVTWQQRPPP
jgi:hypothetical protein